MNKNYIKLFNESDFTFKIANNLSEIGENVFLETYQEIFRIIPAEYFRWYDFNKNYWGLLFDNEQKLIGLYGLLKTAIFFNGQKYDSYLCHNVGITKNYEGKGLFQFISELTLSSVLNNQNLVLGFPNKSSARGHFRIGWKKISSVSFYQFKQTRIHYPVDYDIEKVEVFDDSINNLFSLYYKNYSLSLNKDKDYLNWRLQKPEAKYECFLFKRNSEISGYVILKEFFSDNVSKLHVVDYFGANDEVYSNIFRFAINRFFEKQYDVLNCWAADNTFISSILIQNGFEQLEDNIYPIILFNLDENFEVDHVDKSRILFTLFDNDVF